MDFREPIYGYRAPSPLWCFVLSCMVGGIFRKPLGFRRRLPPARPEKAWPFQAGRSPCTKHPRFSGFAFTNLKKFLRVPRGVFSKTHPWQSVGQRPTKREGEPAQRGMPFQAGRSPFTKHPQTVRLGLYAPKKVFGGSKGRFFKNAPLAGSGTESHKERASQPSGCAFSGGTKSFHETPTDRLALPLHTEKVFEGSKGRFFKNAPLAGSGTASHKRRASQPSGHAFSSGTRSFHETPTDRPAWPLRPEKSF